MMNYIKNEKALCSAIVLQAVKDYKDCTKRIKKLEIEIPKVEERQAREERERHIARRAFKARRAVVKWQARIAIARERAIQAEAYRKEMKELKLELLECKEMINYDLIPFFEGEWCDFISPLEGNKILSHLKSNRPLLGARR